MNEFWEPLPVLRGYEPIAPIFTIINTRGFIGGSYAAYMASCAREPMQPNDIDIFATTNEHAKDIAETLAARFAPGRFGGWDFNGLVYSIKPIRSAKILPIQVITPNPEWKTFPDDILNSFDLDVSRAVLVAPNEILADRNIGAPTGKLLRIGNPLRSLKRVMKYAKRNIEFEERELIKLFLAWQEMSEERRQEVIASAQPADVIQSSEWYMDDDYYDAE